MKYIPTLRIALCTAFFGVISAQAADAPSSRVWTDNKGRQVDAVFLGLDGDNIMLQTSDGNTHRFPLSNLSAEDQQVAKTLKPASGPTGAVGTLPVNASVAQAAAKIDLLVAKGVVRANPERVKKGLEPITSYNPLTNDEQFVRRVFLDIVGRIPSYDETYAFINDTSPTKRAKLIDQLLDSPGSASNNYNYFAEMLRVKDRLDQANVRGIPYINWLKEQVAANKPWDKLVHEMLVADGKMWDKTENGYNGAAGYLLRDSGMPLDNLANTLTVFLGTDVACAQCHDHPFADWTQMQFYEMASFFGATTTQLGRMDFGEVGDPRMRLMPEIESMVEKAGMDLTRFRNGINNYIGANRYAVQDRKENMLKLPHDYKYKDGKPGDPVAPKFITWAPQDRGNPAYKQSKRKEERLRDSFAAWLTHPENPRFAMTIANRMWKRAFGAGVAEPVTNIDDPQKAANPELLLHLTAEMKRVKFDLKEFARIVYNTKAYQAEATTDPIPMGEPYYFQGPQLRRMSAEQAWDSYMTLVLGDPDKYRKKDALTDLYSRAIDLNLANPKLDARTVLQKYENFRNIGRTEREMMGGGSLADAGADMMMDKMEGGAKPAASGADGKMLSYGGMTLMRASELDQPERGGHFLAEFGQSQRMLIDGGSKVGSVPQVLMMMNGNAQEMLTNRSSLIFRAMDRVNTPEEKVDALFLSVMSRHPTESEKEIAKREVSADGDTGYSNIIWALINTREFIFIQ